MQQDLITLICCPACDGNLRLISHTMAREEIWEGVLQCGKCASTYPVDKGMPHLYSDDESWLPKAQEAQGWIAYHQNLGIYEQEDDAIDLKIPYYPQQPWLGISRGFDIALERLKLGGGGERILDLGAGRGWAAKQFSLRGCTVVALDIASDENVGLGRAKALMEDAGTYFERVIADGERLPFHPETFDVVFCNASLHHSSNIPLLLQNVSKVLKQGGRFCAIEPSISILESEEDVLARYATAELELNINENRPNFLQYREGLESNGLSITEAFPTHTYYMGAHDLAEWARDMGAISPALRIRQPLRTMSRLATFLAKRARAMYMGKPRPPGGLSDERQRLIQATLWWADNELFLLATKESRPVVPEEDVTAPVQKRL